MTEKLNKILDKANVWMPCIMGFLIRLSAKILLYIMAVFVITGVFRFRPDILMQLFDGHAADAVSQDISLQEYWKIAIIIIMAVEMAYDLVRLTYRNAGLMELIMSLVASYWAYVLVAGTDFVGDRMLAAYLFWWVIKGINWWLLRKTGFEIIVIHDTDSMGTAVCMPKENDYIRASRDDLEEHGYEVKCTNLKEMTPSMGYKPKSLSEVISTKSEDQ